VIKTYAPEGRTSVIRQKVTRDQLSVMGGMTPVRKLYKLARQESLEGLDTMEFLDHLLRAAGESRLVIWGGSPTHRRLAVKGYVSDTDGRIWLDALPPFAPTSILGMKVAGTILRTSIWATGCAMTSSSSVSTSPGFEEGPNWFSPSLPRHG
jgi:hypothetical protein